MKADIITGRHDKLNWADYFVRNTPNLVKKNLKKTNVLKKLKPLPITFQRQQVAAQETAFLDLCAQGKNDGLG